MATTEILVSRDAKMTVVVDNGQYPKPMNPILLIPVGCQQQPNGREVLVIQKSSETTAVPLILMPKAPKPVVHHQDRATSSLTGTNSIMVPPTVSTAPAVFDNVFNPNSCANLSLEQSEGRTMSLVDTKPAQIELSNSTLDTDRLWVDNRHSSASTRSLDLDIKMESPDLDIKMESPDLDIKDDSPPVHLRSEPVDRVLNSDGGDSDGDSSTNATAGGEMLNEISFGSSSSPTGVSAEELLTVEMRDSPVPLPVDVSTTATSVISNPVSLVTQSNQQFVISATIPAVSIDSSARTRLNATEILGRNGTSLVLNPIDLIGSSSSLVDEQQANGVPIQPRPTTKPSVLSVPVKLVLVKPGTSGSPAQIALVQQPQQINKTSVQQSSTVNSLESEFEKERKCSKCAAVFRSKQGLNRHLNACLSDKQIACPGCNSLLKTNSGLASHMRACNRAKKLSVAKKEESKSNGNCIACDDSCVANFDAKRKKQGIPLGKIKATGTYFPPVKTNLPPVVQQFQLRDNHKKSSRNPNQKFQIEALSAAEQTISKCYRQQTPDSSTGSTIQNNTLPTTEHTYNRQKPKLASVKINGTFFPPCHASIPGQQRLSPPEQLKANDSVAVSDAQSSTVSNLSNEQQQPVVETERNFSAYSTVLASSEPPAPTPSIETSDERLFNFNTTIICNNSKSRKDSKLVPNSSPSAASDSTIDSPANATNATPCSRSKRKVNGRRKAVDTERLKKRNNFSPRFTRQTHSTDKNIKACSIWNFETPYRKASIQGKQWQQKAAWHCAQSLVKRGKGCQLDACQLLLETLAEFGLKGKLTTDHQLTEKLLSSLSNSALTKGTNASARRL